VSRSISLVRLFTIYHLFCLNFINNFFYPFYSVYREHMKLSNVCNIHCVDMYLFVYRTFCYNIIIFFYSCSCVFLVIGVRIQQCVMSILIREQVFLVVLLIHTNASYRAHTNFINYNIS